MGGERSDQCWAFSVVSSGNSTLVSWRFTIKHLHTPSCIITFIQRNLSLVFNTTESSLNFQKFYFANEATIEPAGFLFPVLTLSIPGLSQSLWTLQSIPW